MKVLTEADLATLNALRHEAAGAVASRRDAERRLVEARTDVALAQDRERTAEGAIFELIYGPKERHL